MDPVYLKNLIIDRPSELWFWYDGLKERNEEEIEANLSKEDLKKREEDITWDKQIQKQEYKKIQKDRQKLWQDLTTE